MWHICGLVFLVLALITLMIIVQPDPNRKPPPGRMAVSQPMPYDRQPWNGQQYVEPTGSGSLFDIEYDAGHSGFLGNANYKAPPFIAGMTAMHQV